MLQEIQADLQGGKVENLTVEKLKKFGAYLWDHKGTILAIAAVVVGGAEVANGLVNHFDALKEMDKEINPHTTLPAIKTIASAIITIIAGAIATNKVNLSDRQFT